MARKMLIDATHAEETRVVVADGNKVEEFDFESVSKRQLAGNIYLAKVTRVEPSLQAAFVDYGGNRHGFLAFSEIHPDYYQIPVADRQALLAEEQEFAGREDSDEQPPEGERRRRSSRGRGRAARTSTPDDATATAEAVGGDIPGMGVIDLETSEDDADAAAAGNPPILPEEQAHDAPGTETGPHEPGPTAADADADIESVASEDVEEEIRRPRQPRRYKIQEVIKVRQILLVQVVKEERGNKGAALTTYLSLAGRYCVLMPNTARGGGISRKITNVADRKKLKAIAGELEVPQGAGLIIRTAGSQRTKAEIRRDYEYLMRLWEQIRDLTLNSIAPAPIYEEGNLIKRSIRDLYNRDIDEILVEGEDGYRLAKDFMKMLMPSHAKNVKHYTDPMPLFARFQVESYLSSMFNPVVQLRSGGYIVIGVTEALVAIDVNSGRATKEGSIEETALKTNLEAAEEVARQVRLRDLAGLIVIDFIDMDERRNNAAVEKRLKEKLKSDRARIQVGRISGFGLLEMSRQRLRPGMIEATTAPCPHCHGTGIIRNHESLALSVLRQLEEEGVRQRSREVLVKLPVGIANFLINNKREHVIAIEARYGLSVRIEADPTLVSPNFTVERFKTATRVVPDATRAVISMDSRGDSAGTGAEDAIETETEELEQAEQATADAGTEEGPRKKRRRRRRRGGKGANGEAQTAQSGAPEDDTGAKDSPDTADAEPVPDGAGVAPQDVAAPEPETAAPAPAKPRRRRSRKTPDAPQLAAEDGAASPAEAGTAVTVDGDAPAEPAPEPAAEQTPAAEQAAATAAPAPEPRPVTRTETALEPVPQQPPEPAETEDARQEAPADEDAAGRPRPRRRGWWSAST